MEKISNKNFIEELIVENVNFSFGFKDILKDINFTLKKGYVVLINQFHHQPKGFLSGSFLLNLCAS